MGSEEINEIVAVGSSRSSYQSVTERVSCILCQEDEQIKLTNRAMVLTGLSHRLRSVIKSCDFLIIFVMFID